MWPGEGPRVRHHGCAQGAPGPRPAGLLQVGEAGHDPPAQPLGRAGVERTLERHVRPGVGEWVGRWEWKHRAGARWVGRGPGAWARPWWASWRRWHKGWGLEGFGGRMTLGEDSLWRGLWGWIQCGWRSGGGEELFP